MFAVQEFESMSISSETVTAQQKADLAAFRDATRERALTRYDQVNASGSFSLSFSFSFCLSFSFSFSLFFSFSLSYSL